MAARRCLSALQSAELTVWADGRGIQQVQMAREQFLQQLHQQGVPPSQQRQMLQQLENNSLYLPGMVAVQRLQDAAAVSLPLSEEYLKEISGLALVADGSETPEEFAAVVGRPVSDLLPYKPSCAGHRLQLSTLLVVLMCPTC